jgi:hypothetical protein
MKQSGGLDKFFITKNRVTAEKITVLKSPVRPPCVPIVG